MTRHHASMVERPLLLLGLVGGRALQWWKGTTTVASGLIASSGSSEREKNPPRRERGSLFI
jgi:hypothetical protein